MNLQKDGETPSKRRRRRTRQLAGKERKQKDGVRDRDRVCRFPLCGCLRSRDAMKAFPTVSHDKHKGIGGNPTGDRSVDALMILLCKWRHQDGRVSRHAGNIRTVYLTDRGNNGPIEWEIRRDALEVLFSAAWPAEISLLMTATVRSEWIVLATETEPRVLKSLEPWQVTILERLAEMDV